MAVVVSVMIVETWECQTGLGSVSLILPAWTAGYFVFHVVPRRYPLGYRLGLQWYIKQ